MQIRHISNGQLKKFIFLVKAAIFNGEAGLSDTILKGTHPGAIPARFGLIWFSGFRILTAATWEGVV
jgi:hypothetical protein